MKHLWFLAVCLAFLPLYVCPVSAQNSPKVPISAAPTLTGPITKISIAGLMHVSLDTVQSKLTLKVGDAYTSEAAQKDVDALKTMGVFQTKVSVSATQTKTVTATQISLSGIDLTYTVTENPIVQSIKFTTNTPSGLLPVPSADLIAQMKTQVGQVLNTNILVKDLDNLFSHENGYVAKRGYFMGVSSDINIDPATGILAIPLLEYQIKSITVVGNNRVKTADILAQMHTKIGGIFNNDTFGRDQAAIYAMGNFRQISFTQTTNGSQMDIALTVVEQAPATGVLNEKQGKVIPFLYDPITMPTPIVQVSINGKPPLSFIVDTGCTAGLLLDFWAAQKLGLPLSDADQKADNYVYKRTSVQDVVLVGRGSGGSADFGTQPAQAANLDVIDQIFANQHIAGVVGLGLLASITSRFDFAACTLTIFTASHPPLSIPGGTTLPLKGSSTGLFDVRTTLAPNTYADLILDTGSSSTQVPLSSLKALHPAATASGGGARIDLMFLCPDLRLAALDFGQLHVPNVVVSVLPLPLAPALGLDILAGYRLTLDGPNGQLILEPSAHGGRYATGHSGLEVKQSGEKWFVSALALKMPAQKAGLQRGDEILTVGKEGVRKLTRMQIAGRLSGIAGKPVQVSIRRRTKVLAISWVPGDEFSAPRSAMDGVSMTKAPGGPWVVVDVLKGCAGDLAGLQVEDKITHVDGQAVADIPMSGYGGEDTKEQPKVLLEVERSGVAQPFTITLLLPKQPEFNLTLL